MDSSNFLIILSTLALISYGFELFSAKIKVPPVVLLIFLGFIAGIVTKNFLGVTIPYLDSILPLLGTIGLILIVLEGGLELEITSKSIPILKRTLAASFILLIVNAIVISFLFWLFYSEATFLVAMLNAAPFAVISSAVAIPGVQSLSKKIQEFVVYESSFSDIFGIMLFNILLSLQIESASRVASSFFVEIILIIFISFVSCAGLIYLIDKVKHHLKYLPIFFVLLMVYGISKKMHLSPLITVLLLGLTMNNIGLILNVLSKIPIFKPTMKTLTMFFSSPNLAKEVSTFKGVIVEGTFLMKTFFFLIFGYTINIVDLNFTSILLTAIMMFFVILFRFFYLKIFESRSSKPVSLKSPLLYIAPRGLITMLLFLTIPTEYKIVDFDIGILPSMVIFSAIAMTVGIIVCKKSISNEEKQS